MRRQTGVDRQAPVGSSRIERLDPFTLPVRFEVGDHAADGRVRSVELTRERVVLRRALRGMLMAVNLPLTAYLGVAIRMEQPEADAPGAVAVVLEHRDAALSLPLYRADDSGDVAAEWQAWGRVLGLPLLVTETDGRLREPFLRIGRVQIAACVGRRRRRSAIKRRRPSLPLRRRPGRQSLIAAVHRGEREIIARN